MSVSDQSRESRESNIQTDPATRVTTLRSGVVGGVVAVLLSFLPLSTSLGGGVAGYLDRSVGRRGTAAGAIAGTIAAVPYLLVGLSLVLSPAWTLPGPNLALSPALVVAGAASFALVYAVGLGALGSLVGGYLYDER